jgi:hypothetical protein
MVASDGFAHLLHRSKTQSPDLMRSFTQLCGDGLVRFLLDVPQSEDFARRAVEVRNCVKNPLDLFGSYHISQWP